MYEVKEDPFVESFGQRKDARIRGIFSGQGFHECDDVDSMPSDRLSSDLGDTWHHGPPIRPRQAGGLELGTDDHTENTAEEEREDWSSEELGRGVGRAARDYVSKLRERESSLWAPLCDCLTRADVLVLRTAGSKLYDALLH